MSETIVPCPKCGVEIGRIVVVRGLVFLRLGSAEHPSNILIRDLRGLCMQCGHTIYWQISDREIEQLVKSIKLAGG